MKQKTKKILQSIVFALVLLIAEQASASPGNYLSPFSYTAGSFQSGATTTYTFTYTNYHAVPASNMIFYAAFPSGFSVASPLQATVTINGVSKTPSMLSTWSGVMAYVELSESVPLLSNVVVNIQGVTNPATAGNYNFSFIRTADAGGNPIDIPASISPIVITGSTHALTYTAGANGTLSGTASQTVNDGSSGTQVTAVPNAGYHFVNWSDGSTQNPRTDTNVISNKSVTANFALTLAVSGVTDGKLYFDNVIPTFNTGAATLNGNAFTSGTAISADGHYVLAVTDGTTNLTYTFDILKEKTVSNPDTPKINSDLSLGIIAIRGSDPTKTSEATIKLNYTLQNNGYSLLLPKDTVITEKNNSAINITDLTVQNLASAIKSIVPSSKGAIKIGIPDVSLDFSKSVTISFPVDPGYNDKTLKVYSRPGNGTDWIYETTCTVTNSTCSFQADHATEFTANYEVSNSPDPTHVNVDINSTITIDCKDASTKTNDYIYMNPITGTGQSQLDGNNDVNCNVITNNSSGYTLSFTSSVPELKDVNGDTIAAYTPATTNVPETWSVSTADSEWGARLQSSSTTYNSTTWGPINTDDYSTKWYSVTNSNNFILADRSTETAQTGDDQVIRFGAEIGASKFQPTGTYTDTVTFTAVTN